MQDGRRNGWEARPTAVLLTLAAHVLFILLLLIERRNAPRPSPAARELVAIPITLTPLVMPPEQLPDTESAPDVAQPSVRAAPPPPRTTPPPRPATAITLAPSTQPAERATPDNPRDWSTASSELAARYAERAEGSAPTFSPPPAKMREPCTPPRQSFKFKADQPPGKGGSAMLTLGWEEPDPDKHFFDDMKAGKKSSSSVPDPITCD